MLLFAPRIGYFAAVAHSFPKGPGVLAFWCDPAHPAAPINAARAALRG